MESPDIQRDILHLKIADGVAIGSLPATGAMWLWLDKLDLLLRISVSAGTFVLICFAIWAKVKQWRKP